MGNNHQFRITNALPVNAPRIFLVGSSSKIIPESKDVVHKATIKGNAQISKALANANISGDYYYENATKYRFEQVDWKFYAVAGGTTQVKLTEETQYMTAYFQIDGIKFTIFQNLSLSAYQSYAGFVFYQDKGYVVFGQLLKGNNFRLVRKNAGSHPPKNYPPGYTCNECGHGPNDCKQGCPRYKDSY